MARKLSPKATLRTRAAQLACFSGSSVVNAEARVTHAVRLTAMGMRSFGKTSV